MAQSHTGLLHLVLCLGFMAVLIVARLYAVSADVRDESPGPQGPASAAQSGGWRGAPRTLVSVVPCAHRDAFDASQTSPSRLPAGLPRWRRQRVRPSAGSCASWQLMSRPRRRRMCSHASQRRAYVRQSWRIPIRCCSRSHQFVRFY